MPARTDSEGCHRRGMANDDNTHKHNCDYIKRMHHIPPTEVVYAYGQQQ